MKILFHIIIFILFNALTIINSETLPKTPQRRKLLKKHKLKNIQAQEPYIDYEYYDENGNGNDELEENHVETSK